VKHASKHDWTLVINGADRGELSKAFRGSQWEDSWYERASLLEDHDPDAGVIVSLSIPNLNTLVDALRCVGHIRATHGICLCGNADFDSIRASYSLCTEDSGFAVSDCTLHRTIKSLKSPIMIQIAETENALSKLRMLIAQSEGSHEGTPR
jgi:hypothetical protein